MVKVKHLSGTISRMFRIAAFAGLAGVSTNVLRDYDRLAIFRPAFVDPDTGYRLYSPAQLPELQRIVALRELGVSLSELRTHLEGRADLRGILEGRRAALEAARRETDRRLATLGITLSAESVVVRPILPQLVATLRASATGGDVGAAFYELESQVRDRHVRAGRPPGELTAAQPDDVEVYVPVTRVAPGLYVRRLPQIRAATILHRGSYETIDETRAVLESWVKAADLETGTPERIVYLQFGAESDLRLPDHYLVERDADLLTELQVPIHDRQPKANQAN